MKILITGAAGFIGSNLAEYLLQKKYEVIGIDNFNTYYDPKVKEYNVKDFSQHENFKLHRIDLLDKTALEKVFTNNTDIQAVVHLAAWPGVTRSFDTPDLYIRNNIEATANLAEMCKTHGPKNFIFASTSSIYGANQTPFVETMPTDKPLAPYPATKKACEVLLYSYSKYFGLQTTMLRIFNPNGIKLRPDLAIPKLVKSCLYGFEFPMYAKKGEDVMGRDYCYVEHILGAIEYIINNPFEYEIFNLGNSSPVTLPELVKTVEKVVGNSANIVYKETRNGEMPITYANIEKAKKYLNYNPTTSIEQIVKIYLDWFVKQEEWYRKLTTV
jgi:UDP-glucuronate 4-epimerase